MALAMVALPMNFRHASRVAGSENSVFGSGAS